MREEARVVAADLGFIRAAALVLSACAALAGCGVLGDGRDGTTSGVVYQPEPGLDAGGRIRLAKSLLNEGRETEARVELAAAQAVATPAQKSTIDSFFRQLDTDPYAYFAYRGVETFDHRVQRGDTLSKIAKTYLGDADKFVALARYNEIRKPGSLKRNDLVRIPGERPAAPVGNDALAAPDAGASAAAIDDPLAGIEEAVAGGSYAAAIACMEALGAGARSALDAERLRAIEAAAYCGEARARSSVDDRLLARALFRCAESEAAVGGVDARVAALRMTAEAASLDPANAEAALLRSTLRRELKPEADEWHRVASAHYSREEFAEAVALWEKTILVDPGNISASRKLDSARKALEAVGGL